MSAADRFRRRRDSDPSRNGYVDTQKFIKLVKPPMKVDPLILPRGGHNFGSWVAKLPQSIRGSRSG